MDGIGPGSSKGNAIVLNDFNCHCKKRQHLRKLGLLEVEFVEHMKTYDIKVKCCWCLT